MKHTLILLTLFISAAAPVAADEVLPISLLCVGSGSATSDDITTASVVKDGKTSSVMVMNEVKEPFTDEIKVEISSATSGRMLFPRSLLPAIHGGNDSGWLDMRNLNVTPDEIQASVNTGFTNNPKVRIDRKNGLIKISGKTGHFAGSCNPIDPSSPNRF